MTRWIHAAIAVIVLAVMMSACGGSEPPSAPGIIDTATTSHYTGSSHSLLSYNLISVDATDPDNIRYEIIPVRIASGHMNVLSWLEDSPCDDCLKITAIDFIGSGHFEVEVEISHPFPITKFTAFDVRGIVMLDGAHMFPDSGLRTSDFSLGDGEIVNPDGCTSLYNWTTAGNGIEGYIEGKLATSQPPNSTLNPFKIYVSQGSDNTRNAFYAGDSVSRIYEIRMPFNVFRFGYAVDACWTPPTIEPVTDPMTDFPPEANCPEPYKIVVNQDGGDLDVTGSSTDLLIAVYDWQGKDDVYPPTVECPELFDGQVTAEWEEDGDGYTIYRATIQNSKFAPPGEYWCLVSKVPVENDDSSGWMDLTAHRICRVEVITDNIWPYDVTPPQLNFRCLDVRVDGDYAYCAAGTNGMHIVDISDPSNPEWFGAVSVPGYIGCIDTWGGYAFVENGNNDDSESGLVIIDIDPVEDAEIFMTIELGENVYDIEVYNGYAFVLADPMGLVIVDVDPVEDAYIVTSVETTDHSPQAISVTDGYAFVACGILDGTDIIDIDPVEDAAIINTLDFPGNSVTEVLYHDGYLYLSGSESYYVQGIYVYDVDPIDTPEFVKYIENSGIPREMVIKGGYGFVTDSDEGVQVIDIDPIEDAEIVATIPVTGSTYVLEISGDDLYICDWYLGLKVVDISEPESPSVTGSCDAIPSNYSKVATRDGYAYITTRYGLYVIDFDPPSLAHVVSIVNPGVYFYGIDIQHNYAFVIQNHGDLYIYDISSPDDIQLVTIVETPLSLYGIVVDNFYAYVTGEDSAGDDWFGVIDIHPIESASMITRIPAQYAGSEIEVTGDYAFLMIDNDFTIIDISIPDFPEVVYSQEFHAASQLEVGDGYAFLTGICSDSGLRIMDIDPAEETHYVDFIGMDDPTGALELAYGYAFVGAAEYSPPTPKLFVFDIDPVYSTTDIAEVVLPNYLVDIEVEGKYLFATGGTGLSIIKLW